MSRVYDHRGVVLHRGDCLDVLSTLGDASVNSVVTDPPYALEFMGKTWDKYTPASYQAWCEKWATECLRVLKPGGHLLAFGGTRTAHRLACGIEDAGFELRDTITWMYSSGFPKSRDISKDIDKAAGAVREIVGFDKSRARPNRQYESGAIGNIGGTGKISDRSDNGATLTAPATDEAKQWDGWGTALKPASEPIIVARKPFKGTVAQNVLTHGTGGMNIDGCRVGNEQRTNQAGSASSLQRVTRVEQGYRSNLTSCVGVESTVTGRWPSNLVLSHASTVDGEDACADGCVPGCPVAELDAQSGHLSSGSPPIIRQAKNNGPAYGAESRLAGTQCPHYADSGGASRFYPVFRYQAKAPKHERPLFDGRAHATVKPLALMRWLVRLVTPPGGLVLDPLCGTGTTGQAARDEGMRAVLIDSDLDSIRWAIVRLEKDSPSVAIDH